MTLLPGRSQRRTTLRLHGMQCCSRAAGVKTFGQAGCEGSPTHLHKEPCDELGPHVFGDVGHFPTDGATAIQTPSVLRALHTKRNRPRLHRFAKPMHARVTRGVGGEARAVHHVGAKSVQAGNKCSIGKLGHKHSDGPIDCARQCAGGKGSVTTRSNCQRRTSIAAPLGDTQPLGGHQM